MKQTHRNVDATKALNQSFKGLVMDHAGTDLSFRLTIESKRKLGISFPDGRTKSICTAGKAPINVCCPSVEGTVIWVSFKDNTQGFYEVETGEMIDELFLEKVKRGEKCLPQITLYN